MKRLILLLICCTALAPAKIYKGAEYRTKESYTYGRFEVRLKSAYRDGMLTSFFTYNDNYPATEWNEIDIEILGRYRDVVQFNPITPGQLNHVSHYRTSFDPSADFHEYGFEWTPDYVAWFVDGQEVHRQTGAHIAQLNLPQKIMMNIWPPVYYGWVGQWDENALPAFTYYDWVRYSSYTPDSGNVGTGNNFTVQWKDEFTAWDTARWQKATHTFNGNNCDFIPANVVFKDGMLILCLTKENAVGYTDNTGPFVKHARAEKEGVLIRFTEELDTASAQNPASYINAAYPVTAAAIQDDRQSVLLTLSNYHRDSVSNVVINNVKDLSGKNSSGVKNAVLIKPVPLTFPVKVNCGGPALNGYLPDQEWGPTVEYGRMDGANYSNMSTTTGPADPLLFRTEANGLVKYRFRVPNGMYSVTLLMAENFFTEQGKRNFTVSVEECLVIRKLDLIRDAGFRVQVQRTIAAVPVKDGILDIHFMAEIDNAVVNAIIVEKVIASVDQGMRPLPARPSLGQNYPNPFNGRTVIPVTAVNDEPLTLRVFDALGRMVHEQALGALTPGEHPIAWDARTGAGHAVATGLYLYTVEGRNFRSAKKMLLVR
ncbi:MAG: family 16 glycosylhydrolase [Bacteroidetes bacterium]|nr:family 16 glycosylhydrolase [Bacteroidota bacterium]